MESPFPGMDPYLEARWSDVHASLIFAIKEALQPTLPAGMRARTEERVLLEDVEGEPMRQYRPDVAVIDSARSESRQPSAMSGTLAVAEPVIVEYHDGPAIDRFVQIIDVSNRNRVITCIELLNPWNKSPGRLNKEYLRKLDDYIRGDVSLVEVDLLRSPRGRLRVIEGDLPADRRTPYFIGVRRAWWGERWAMYPVPLREPIRPVPVPLRQSDQDVYLELQPLIRRVYVAGGHDDIDYTRPPEPPLSAEDEVWANELLRKAGRR
jgi:hypothetical protein